jgi:hypothetical protein
MKDNKQLERWEDKDRSTYYRPTQDGYARAIIREYADKPMPFKLLIDSSEVVNFFNLEGVGGVERILEVVRQWKEGKEPVD